MKTKIFTLLIFMSFSLCYGQPLADNEKTIFNDYMSELENSWNSGDIDGYMNYFWGSDSLVFIVDGQVTRGWQKVRDDYENTYPDSASMGNLKITELYFYQVHKTLITVSGIWEHSTQKGIRKGVFTFIWRKIKNRWIIVYDHTNKQ